MTSTHEPARPRPVVLAGALATLLSALAATAAVLDVLPTTAVPAVLAVAAAAPLGAAFIAQLYVTPLSDPRSDDGTPLLTAPEAITLRRYARGIAPAPPPRPDGTPR